MGGGGGRPKRGGGQGRRVVASGEGAAPITAAISSEGMWMGALDSTGRTPPIPGVAPGPHRTPGGGLSEGITVAGEPAEGSPPASGPQHRRARRHRTCTPRGSATRCSTSAPSASPSTPPRRCPPTPQTNGGDAPPQTHTHIHTLRKRPTDRCVSMFHLPPGPAARLTYPPSPRSVGSVPDGGTGGGRAASKEAVAAAAQVLRSRPRLRSPAAPDGQQGRGWAGRRPMKHGIPSDPKGMALRVFLWCPN